MAAIYAASQSTYPPALIQWQPAGPWTSRASFQEGDELCPSDKNRTVCIPGRGHSWPSAFPWYWQTVKSNPHTSGSTDSWVWCWACWAVPLPLAHSQRWPMQRALTWHSFGSCHHGLHQVHGSCGLRIHLVLFHHLHCHLAGSWNPGEHDYKKDGRGYIQACKDATIYHN